MTWVPEVPEVPGMPGPPPGRRPAARSAVIWLLAALAGSYERPGPAFWLSPFADPLAVFRVLLSTVRRPRAWRGRQYAA